MMVSKLWCIARIVAWINLFIYLIAIIYCAIVAILAGQRYWTSMIFFILFVSTILQILILILLHDLSSYVYSHACSPSLQEPTWAPLEPHWIPQEPVRAHQIMIRLANFTCDYWSIEPNKTSLLLIQFLGLLLFFQSLI